MLINDAIAGFVGNCSIETVLHTLYGFVIDLDL